MEYLKPTNLCESNDSEIGKLAKKIIGDKKDEAAAKALFYWVRDNVIWDIVDIVGAKAVLKRKPMRAICIDKNNLMVALCRASGIPARYIMITGRLKVKKKEIDVDMPHVGCEVLIRGKWVIADPSYGEETKSIIEVSEFGVPIWSSAKEESGMAELPKPVFPDGMNQGLKQHPVAAIYKKLLAQLRSK